MRQQILTDKETHSLHAFYLVQSSISHTNTLEREQLIQLPSPELEERVKKLEERVRKIEAFLQSELISRFPEISDHFDGAIQSRPFEDPFEGLLDDDET